MPEPRKPKMAEEASGEEENPAEPDTKAQQRALQETFESGERGSEE